MKKNQLSLPLSLLLFGAGYALATLTRKQDGEEDPSGYVPEPFDKDAGTPVTPSEGGQFTRNYRANSNTKKVLANYCGCPAIKEILDNPDCAGLRIYQAIGKGNARGIVIIGVDVNGKDITEKKDLEQKFLAAYSGDKCESNCDRGSVLMM